MIEQKNPNMLQGHEGALLRLTKQINCYSANEYREVPRVLANAGPISIPRGEIVMYLKTVQYKDEDEYGHIDLLWGKRKVRYYLQINNWMRVFCQWPHGGFVSHTSK